MKNLSQKELLLKLPTGDTDGIKSLEFTDKALKVVRVPKTQAGEFEGLYSEIDSAVYLFVATEQKEIFSTLNNGVVSDDGFYFDWDICLVVTFSDGKMSREFADYLQFIVSELVALSDDFTIRNKYSIYEPATSSPTKTACKEDIKVLDTLLTLFGYKIINNNNQLEGFVDTIKSAEITETNKPLFVDDVPNNTEPIVDATDKESNTDITSVINNVPPTPSYSTRITLNSIRNPSSYNSTSYSQKSKATIDTAITSSLEGKVDLPATKDSSLGSNTESEKQQSPSKDFDFKELLFKCQDERINSYAVATYNPDTNEMTVLKGSRFPVAELKSYLSDEYRELRERLIATNVLVHKGDCYELSQDHVFNSPSLASVLVLGRGNNGKNEWKTGYGKKLSFFIARTMLSENKLLKSKTKPKPVVSVTHAPKVQVVKQPVQQPVEQPFEESFEVPATKEEVPESVGVEVDIEAVDAQEDLFICSDGDTVYAEATYDPESKTITVQKGSTFALDMIDSLVGSFDDKEKKKMIREGALELDDDYYISTRDYTFKSVNRASTVVSGRNGDASNWININGLNINEYYHEATPVLKAKEEQPQKDLILKEQIKGDMKNYYIKNNFKRVYAVANKTPNHSKRITVLKGSSFAKITSKHMGLSRQIVRERLIESGILEEFPDCYILSRDYTFDDAEQAAVVILGGYAQQEDWTDKDGNPLSQQW